ncbi:MAG: globin [bacterium]|nr:globin [bacterium]
MDFSFAGEESIDYLYGIIGEEGIAGLTAAFYRQVPQNTTLAPMYPSHSIEESEIRLRDFLVFRFGGPRRYIEQRGHPSLRMRHAPFPINQAVRNEWVTLMHQAVDEMSFSAKVSSLLLDFFHQVATFLINQNDVADR